MTLLNLPEQDDAEVILRSRDDPEQFAAVFDRYARQIHLYVARRLGTQAADDIVAETFLAAFRRRESYDPSVRLARPWLYGIATKLIARHRRDEERLLRALSRTGADPLPELIGDVVTQRVAAQAEERRLMAALAALSPGDRDVLLLVAWEDMSLEEAAQALGIPAGTARSRMHRARKKIKAVIPAEEENR
ncbi:RNA polymerase sigma factor [Nonomuraea spiralis]|uniref:RNA polymerase sigma factor n=1 Tax=Nonomuraea spiralis TaxID=46182 RepID=A0ABV5IU72_9ACTN|nr:RNA polymerase sigma factor [Nonomuraea spiralis]GGT05310.1 DNA-directed RNA polymerase sigma-70 factor [Nonomuraea spiralis]